MNHSPAAMEAYHIHDGTLRIHGWPWAYTLRPWPSELGSPCEVCGKGQLFPGRYPQFPFTAEVEKGTSYPDALGCAYSMLIVSEAVCADWETEGVTGFRKYPLTIARATGKLKDVPPPPYYHIEVTGRCELDTDAMGIRVFDLCPKCGSRDFEVLNQDPSSPDHDPFELTPYIIREVTWDGSDLFISPLFDRVVFCTRKVFDLASKYRRTNFCFTRPEENHTTRKCLPYLTPAQRRELRRERSVVNPKPPSPQTEMEL